LNEEFPSASNCKDITIQNTCFLVVEEMLSSLGYFSQLYVRATGNPGASENRGPAQDHLMTQFYHQFEDRREDKNGGNRCDRV